MKFHPTKQNGSKDIRLPMESSGSLLSKISISFKFMKNLGMVLDCKRKKCNFAANKNWVNFQVKFDPTKNSGDPKKYFTLFLHTIRQTKNESHKH